MDIQENESIQKTVVKPTVLTSFMRPKLIWAVAAALTLTFISPILYNTFTTTSIVVERGHLKTLILADGSTIKLNAESTLSYKQGFGEIHRNVTLSGEAYFDVKKGEIPFIVQFGSATVEVLGTEFNIHARGTDVDVSVLEGIVKVSGTEETKDVVLTAGQKVDFINGNNPGNLEKFEHKKYPGWIYNRLILDQTNLKSVCKEIERKFNVKIEFASADLGNITVTGVIDANEFNPVMETLATLAQRSFKFEKDTYIIY
ncbi:MAG: FecR domain-containing protein [Candidatus Marinimicrobia bacterium]|nr:FecR domain-containing protein [Candidatus Neomarinimicrobiota bacterium]